MFRLVNASANSPSLPLGASELSECVIFRSKDAQLAYAVCAALGIDDVVRNSVVEEDYWKKHVILIYRLIGDKEWAVMQCCTDQLEEDWIVGIRTFYEGGPDGGSEAG